MGTKLYRNWWLLLVKAVLTALFGIFMILLPETAIRAFSLIAGTAIGLSGVSVIIGSFTHRRYNYEWTWWLLEGLVDIVIAFIIILHPMESASILVVLLGVWIILLGLIQIITSINIQYYMTGSIIFIISGIVALVFGILMILHPGEGLRGITLLLGIFALFYGISQGYISILLRKIVIEEIGEVEDVYL